MVEFGWLVSEWVDRLGMGISSSIFMDGRRAYGNAKGRARVDKGNKEDGTMGHCIMEELGDWISPLLETYGLPSNCTLECNKRSGKL